MAVFFTVYLFKLKVMNIEIVNENKNYWYYNRKGLVCKVMEETSIHYVVKAWLNKSYMSLVYIDKCDCVISDKKVFNKQQTIDLVGDYLGWSECV
jgi:hypothetical protein